MWHGCGKRSLQVLAGLAGVMLVGLPQACAAPPVSEQALSNPNIAIHSSWLLVCSGFALSMTAPGLALYYAGLVRKKNVLSMLMQCIFLMGMMTVLWALVGYSLAFGGTGRWYGNAEYLGMQGVARYWDKGMGQTMTPMYSAELPRITHMLFQGMFFILAPAVICGAFAERMKFSAMVLFSALWGLLVYCPIAHWLWGSGWLSFGHGPWGGALDFAGGAVVHISAGVSALMAACLIGPRLGHRHEPMPPHNLTYTSLGAAMLWLGWLGLSAGSALRMDGVAVNAFMTTHFSAAAGALAWAACEWWQRAKPSVLGASSGAVSGLVAIEPAAGYVGPMSAFVFGVVAAVVCYLACYRLKARLGYDDTLDTFGVHGVGGTVGLLLTGVFATRAAWNLAQGQPLGVIDGNWELLLAQIVATVSVWIYAATVSLGLLKGLDMLMGLRVSSTMERQGLDVTQHGEEGYIFY
jgi:Amt family ammonium transporter